MRDHWDITRNIFILVENFGTERKLPMMKIQTRAVQQMRHLGQELPFGFFQAVLWQCFPLILYHIHWTWIGYCEEDTALYMNNPTYFIPTTHPPTLLAPLVHIPPGPRVGHLGQLSPRASRTTARCLPLWAASANSSASDYRKDLFPPIS